MIEIIAFIILLFISMAVHEYAHGWVAYKLGDDTAKNAGRLTLNPLKHIDPVGTVIFPAVLIALRSLGMNIFVFGWAKPVPVNFLKLKNPKRDMIWVGIAGPCANIILATFSFLLLKMLPYGILRDGLGVFVIINLVFTAFNMIPIPPLDGSRLVMGLLPVKMAVEYSKLERYGFLIIILFLYLGLFEKIVWPMVEFLAHMLGVVL